jgi:hypothetical protein
MGVEEFGKEIQFVKNCNLFDTPALAPKGRRGELKGSAHSADPREKARTMWKCFLGHEGGRFAEEVHAHEIALDTPLGFVRHPPGSSRGPLETTIACRL